MFCKNPLTLDTSLLHPLAQVPLLRYSLSIEEKRLVPYGVSWALFAYSVNDSPLYKYMKEISQIKTAIIILLLILIGILLFAPREGYTDCRYFAHIDIFTGLPTNDYYLICR